MHNCATQKIESDFGYNGIAVVFLEYARVSLSFFAKLIEDLRIIIMIRLCCALTTFCSRIHSGLSIENMQQELFTRPDAVAYLRYLRGCLTAIRMKQRPPTFMRVM